MQLQTFNKDDITATYTLVTQTSPWEDALTRAEWTRGQNFKDSSDSVDALS